MQLSEKELEDFIFADLYDGAIHVDLIELKVRELKPEDFEQIARYRKGIEVYLRNTFKHKQSVYFHLYLIGTFYDAHFLHNILPFHVGQYQYSVGGIQFEMHGPFAGWHMTSGEGRSFRTPKKQLNGQKV